MKSARRLLAMFAVSARFGGGDAATLAWTQGVGGGSAWLARLQHAAVCFDDGVVVTTGGWTASAGSGVTALPF